MTPQQGEKNKMLESKLEIYPLYISHVTNLGKRIIIINSFIFKDQIKWNCK